LYSIHKIALTGQSITFWAYQGLHCPVRAIL
jgi:hypothetical protein